ncbi:MAG: hypothetical protein L3J41_09500 [Melioribacteraceae bacterium]|nr:hypothetical protein [Melioribacteraceae bacterium]
MELCIREIKVRAEWKSIPDDGNGLILANATPESYHSTTNNSTRWFPVALAEYIENENLNGTNFDILININTDSQIQWYYGLDGNTPADKTDFLSTMLHEIAHGLGFADSYSYNTTTKKGSTQYNYFDELIVKNSLPTAFSLLSLANNSTELGTELVSNDLYIMGTRTSAIANGVNPKIYAPTTWVDGTSIAHLDEESYPANDNNSLMTPALGKAEAIHSPGEITLSILEDMGWSVASLITINEPNASSYWVKGSTYQIQWSGNHEILINIDVLKKDSNGDYVDYDQITDSYTSIPGENSPYTWNIPSSYPVGEYKIKMLNEINGYGLSESFHITETASGGPQNTVYFYQRDGQNQIGKIQVWEQNSNFWSEGSYAHSKELPVGSGFSVRSKPGFVTGTTKRFSHMSESYPDVTLIAKYISHSDYIVRENEMAQEKYQSIYLYLKNAGNATVLSNSEGIDGIGSVGFKDPWFYDDTSDPKGTRNRGTSAIWHSSSYFVPGRKVSNQDILL